MLCVYYTAICAGAVLCSDAARPFFCLTVAVSPEWKILEALYLIEIFPDICNRCPYFGHKGQRSRSCGWNIKLRPIQRHSLLTRSAVDMLTMGLNCVTWHFLNVAVRESSRLGFPHYVPVGAWYFCLNILRYSLKWKLIHREDRMFLMNVIKTEAVVVKAIDSHSGGRVPVEMHGGIGKSIQLELVSMLQIAYLIGAHFWALEMECVQRSFFWVNVTLVSTGLHRSPHFMWYCSC